MAENGHFVGLGQKGLPLIMWFHFQPAFSVTFFFLCAVKQDGSSWGPGESSEKRKKRKKKAEFFHE